MGGAASMGRQGRQVQRGCGQDSGLSAVDFGAGELLGLESEPMDRSGAMRREPCIAWGERKAQNKPRGEATFRTWANKELPAKPEEERESPGEWVTGKSPTVDNVQPSPCPPSSPPIQFPFHFATAVKALDLSGGDGRTASQGSVQPLIGLLKHVLCFCYLITAGTGQSWVSLHHPPPLSPSPRPLGYLEPSTVSFLAQSPHPPAALVSRATVSRRWLLTRGGPNGAGLN